MKNIKSLYLSKIGFFKLCQKCPVSKLEFHIKIIDVKSNTNYNNK